MLYVARCNVEIIKSMEKKVRELKQETDQLKQETNLLRQVKEKRDKSIALFTDGFDPNKEKPS